MFYLLLNILFLGVGIFAITYAYRSLAKGDRSEAKVWMIVGIVTIISASAELFPYRDVFSGPGQTFFIAFKRCLDACVIGIWAYASFIHPNTHK
jgi:hypothetical protein